MSARPANELLAGYEALRAAATGSLVAQTPRGLALLLAEGLPGWIRAWNPLPATQPIVPCADRRAVAGLAGEMVRVLTEIALGSRTRLATS
jgi:hypothetical protein